MTYITFQTHGNGRTCLKSEIIINITFKGRYANIHPAHQIVEVGIVKISMENDKVLELSGDFKYSMADKMESEWRVIVARIRNK